MTHALTVLAHAPPIVWLLAGGWLVWWLVWRGPLSRLIWPFGPCPRCKGTGRGWGSNRKRWNHCRRCGGRPERRL